MFSYNYMEGWVLHMVVVDMSDCVSNMPCSHYIFDRL